jgi:transposase
MIDYDTFCHIHHLHAHDGLNSAQIARALALDARTVSHWLAQTHFRPRHSSARSSKLDPYKRTIRQLIEAHPYSAVQIFQRLREAGYEGGLTIVKDYLASVRPRRAPAFLTLAFAPGECAQVDWAHYGSVSIGNTRRKLSFFVMVLCYSRLMYLEFTVSQTMEHFLACHQHAFEFFGHRVPAKIMVDNLRSAVLQRLTGQAPVFNPRYLDFAQHHGFEIVPCAVGKGNEKGRVEAGVGYVKKNLLAGLDLPAFNALNPAARHWLDTIANQRLHGETRRRPVELFEQEKAHLHPMSDNLCDIGTLHTVRASNRFRVTFESNRYSVPAEFASRRLTLKTYPDRLCIYHDNKLIARHPRSYERHRDFEDPDHPRELLAQRRSARHQKLLQRFLALSPNAEHYYQQLELRRLNARHHVHKIIALSDIYGTEPTARALDDARAFEAFSCEYVANLLESRARALPEPAALHLTRRSDLLELELEAPDLGLYDCHPTDHQEPLT